jgi:hypothetical protein
MKLCMFPAPGAWPSPAAAPGRSRRRDAENRGEHDEATAALGAARRTPNSRSKTITTTGEQGKHRGWSRLEDEAFHQTFKPANLPAGSFKLK